MKFAQSIYLLLASSLVAADCTLSSDGNYYCGSTQKVTYGGVGYSGSYKDVSAMNSDGTCDFSDFSFSGNLSPLDEELTLHFRGPLQLKQFGVYYPSSSSKIKKRQLNKKDEEDCATTLVHKHHLHRRATAVVAVTQTVFVDGDGVTQTQDAPAAPQTNAPSSASVAGEDSSSASAAAPASSGNSDSSGSDWTRYAYYTPGSADNCVFMNYNGGSGSGVWDTSFGNSISYANEDNTGGSANAVALGDVTIPSDKEFMIFSGEQCSGNDCGVYREGIPAYHGFDGANKIFVFEFQMPQDSGAQTSINYDMPAIWALNAKIPRTVQYGGCSCWPGCGELDLFEILSSGSNKLISHLHSGQGASGGANNGGGGSQDYFERPYDSTVKAAVVFNGESISIVYVDGATDFGSGLSQSVVDSWVNESGSTAQIQ